MKPGLLFLSLKAFSATGGIEKVSRIAGKALFELCREQNWDFALYSAYDSAGDLDERYVPATVFKGFGGRKARFSMEAVHRGRDFSLVVLSHCNLLPVGYAIRQLFPKTKLVLLAHGIEVWQPFSAWRRMLLQACDLVLPVSEFTRKTMLQLHGLQPKRLKILNNCLDPFLAKPSGADKNRELLERYGLDEADQILFTLTRLSSKERYKGYDEVIMALKTLKKEKPGLRYLIAGRYDAGEKDRLERFIRQQRLEQDVILAGFVPDEELAAHFGLADVYVMPSRKEGFGIVFIEALYYGLPVIAGNVDGSVDALANGELGYLVNPDRPKEIMTALRQALCQGKKQILPHTDHLLNHFGYDVYKQQLLQVLWCGNESGNPDEKQYRLNRL